MVRLFGAYCIRDKLLPTAPGSPAGHTPKVALMMRYDDLEPRKRAVRQLIGSGNDLIALKTGERTVVIASRSKECSRMHTIVTLRFQRCECTTTTREAGEKDAAVTWRPRSASPGGTSLAPEQRSAQTDDFR